VGGVASRNEVPRKYAAMNIHNLIPEPNGAEAGRDSSS
jgi:hypothetical protein